MERLLFNINSRMLALEAYEDAAEVRRKFWLLSGLVWHFETAVHLMEWSNERLREAQEDHTRHCSAAGRAFYKPSPYFGWPFIAARDGAVTIFNIGSALLECQRFGENAVSLKSHFLANEMTAALNAFHTCFPNAAGIRHSVAHAGEQHGNLRKHKFQAVRVHEGKDAGTYVGIENLKGSSFSLTREFVREGQERSATDISFEVSKDSLAQLTDCVVNAGSAFQFLIIEKYLRPS